MRSGASQPAEFAAIAEVFAKGVLRLTQNPRSDAVSEPKEPQERLDVSPAESPPVVAETDHGRPPWRAA